MHANVLRPWPLQYVVGWLDLCTAKIIHALSAARRQDNVPHDQVRHRTQRTEKEKESHNKNRNSSNLSCRSVNWNDFIHASISNANDYWPVRSVHGQCQLVWQMKCTWTWTCTNNFYVGCRRIKSRQTLPVSLAFGCHEFFVSTNAWW